MESLAYFPPWLEAGIKEPVMDDDGDKLYEAILARPLDDLPRLVWADWLDEHDQGDKAKYIRDAIQMFRTEKRKDWQKHLIPNPSWFDLGKSAFRIAHKYCIKSLSQKNIEKFIRDTRNPCSEIFLNAYLPFLHCSMRRGLPYRVSSTLQSWELYQDIVLKRYPIERWRLNDKHPYVSDGLRSNLYSWLINPMFDDGAINVECAVGQILIDRMAQQAVPCGVRYNGDNRLAVVFTDQDAAYRALSLACVWRS